MSLPTPTKKPAGIDPYTRKPERVRVYQWKLDKPAEGEHITLQVGEGDTAYLQLRVSHSASGKAFGARIGQVVDTGGGSFVSSPLDDVNIDAERVARYSEKALDAYAEKVLARLPALFDAVKKARPFGELLGHVTPGAPGHTPVVSVDSKYGQLSNYSCLCGTMERFAGYSSHDSQRAAFERHLADVAPQADEDDLDRCASGCACTPEEKAAALADDDLAALQPTFEVAGA